MKYGTKHARPITVTERQRVNFLAKFIPEPNSGCWLWTGAHDKRTQYGSFGLGTGLSFQAHRVSWAIHREPPPSDKQVLHRCDNPACINPDHLFLGDHAMNMRDKADKGRASAVRGSAHPKAKLTEADIIAIRASTENVLKVLCPRYGISDTKIYRIKTRRDWRHVPC